MTAEQRFEHIERNIQTITDLVVQIAERQSVTEHELQRLAEQGRKNELGMTKLMDTMERLA